MRRGTADNVDSGNLLEQVPGYPKGWIALDRSSLVQALTMDAGVENWMPLGGGCRDDDFFTQADQASEAESSGVPGI